MTIDQFPDQFEVTVTVKDFQNSSREYMDVSDCPLATAVKRVLKQKNVTVGTTVWVSDEDYAHCYAEKSGKIFILEDFLALENNKVEKSLIFVKTISV